MQLVLLYKYLLYDHSTSASVRRPSIQKCCFWGVGDWFVAIDGKKPLFLSILFSKVTEREREREREITFEDNLDLKYNIQKY